MNLIGKYKSILRPEERGVYKCTGYKGRGKSNFAAATENPNLTKFFDFEKKGEGLDAQLHFKSFVPVMEMASGKNASEIWNVVRKEIDNIKKGEFTHIIFDNTAHLEMGMKTHVKSQADKYADMYGMVAKNIRSGAFGGGSGVVNYVIGDMCQELFSKGVQLITVTSHIKPRWAAGGVQVPNSFNIKGAERWDELSILTLVFTDGDFPPIPSAIVMKEQLGESKWDEETGTFSKRRRIPYRLPIADPEHVREYLDHPANLKNPIVGEVPSQEDVQPFSDKFSHEQISMIMAEIKKNDKEEKEAQAAEAELAAMPYVPSFDVDNAKMLRDEGESLPVIAKKLGVKVPELIKAGVR
jgi:hypothetical protein